MIALQARARMEERASTEWPRTAAPVEQGLLVPTVKTVRILIFSPAVFFPIIFYVLAVIWRMYDK